jgi:CheY-like chemotaxis protein
MILNKDIMHKKILLIDDDEDEQFFFSEALKEINTAVKFFSAADASEGLKLMRFLLPDIVFIDINMPLLNGMECLDMIKNDDKIKSIPVVIYSTGMDKTVSDDALKKGAVDCLKKQNTIKGLTAILRKFFILDPVQ